MRGRSMTALPSHVMAPAAVWAALVAASPSASATRWSRGSRSPVLLDPTRARPSTQKTATSMAKTEPTWSEALRIARRIGP
jgi:hypothetical protein